MFGVFRTPSNNKKKFKQIFKWCFLCSTTGGKFNLIFVFRFMLLCLNMKNFNIWYLRNFFLWCEHLKKKIILKNLFFIAIFEINQKSPRGRSTQSVFVQKPSPAIEHTDRQPMKRRPWCIAGWRLNTTRRLENRAQIMLFFCQKSTQIREAAGMDWKASNDVSFKMEPRTDLESTSKGQNFEDSDRLLARLQRDFL